MASVTCIEIRRHFTPLEKKQADEIVGIVADMLVGFLKRGMPGDKGKPPSTDTMKRSPQTSPGGYDAPGIAEGEAHGSQH